MRNLFFLAFAVILASCTPSIEKQLSSGEASDQVAMLAAFQWQERNPIFAKDPTDWTNGAYYTGVARAHKTTKNVAYLDAIEKMGKANSWNTWERFYHADDITISYSYVYLNEQRPGMVNLDPTHQWIQDHFYKDHAWKQGDRTKTKEILWWWCDALFMAPPVLTEYASLTGDQVYLDKTYEFYKQTYDLLWDEEEQLFARDKDYLWTDSPDDRKAGNGKKIFWSRGNGWVLGGLALMLDELPKDYVHRPFYEDLFKTMANRIKELQPADGLWRSSLLDPKSQSHGEVSGSGFYTFAMAWGINNGLLDRAEFEPAVRKAWKGLRACQQASGKVGWVQNIGKDPQPATADSWQNYGTGAFLLAGSEFIKL